MTPRRTIVWPFPFADRWRGRLERRQWGWLVGGFLLLHFASLGLAVLSGNFDPDPNHDHVRVMRDVIETGAPRLAVWPPLFGYWLALQHLFTQALGLPFWTAKLLLDPILVVASGVLSTRLGAVLTRNRWLAMASGFGLVAAPLFLLASAEGLAVLLFQPFFLAALLALVRSLQAPERRWRLAAVGGAWLGVACLVRANPQFLLPALAPGVVWLLAREDDGHGTAGWWRGLSRGVAWVLVAFLAQTAVTAPWLLWQRQLGTEGVFTAPVIYYAWVDGLARHPGNRVSDWVRERRPDLPLTRETVVEIHRHWLREDPAALARLYAVKFVRAWYLSDSGRWDTAIVVLHAPWWLLGFLGLGLWLRRCPRDPAWWLVVAVVLYFWGVSALVSGLARYSAPLYGSIGLAAGVGVLGIRAEEARS